LSTALLFSGAPVRKSFAAKEKCTAPRTRIRILEAHGGRVSWSKTNGKIAFDRLGKDGYYDVWVMNADGSGKRNLTKGVSGLPQKHNGNPAWHPSGEFLVIQSEKEDVPKDFDRQCTPDSGKLNDLWVITAAGARVWPLHKVEREISKEARGVLRPTFSHDGRKLMWAERVGYDPAGFGTWVLKIGEFSFDKTQGPRLTKVGTYNPGNAKAFYEGHCFSPDDKYVLLTSDRDGPLEIYEMEVATGKMTRLTKNSSMTWDEHAGYTPDGKKIIWASSKGGRFALRPFTLRTDYWMMLRDGTPCGRMTSFGAPRSTQSLHGNFAQAAGFDWSPDGKSMAALVIVNPTGSRERGSGPIIRVDFLDKP
jgi:Tol biopolymer transport system component